VQLSIGYDPIFHESFVIALDQWVGSLTSKYTGELLIAYVARRVSVSVVAFPTYCSDHTACFVAHSVPYALPPTLGNR
jgi:hypothetical protein